MVREIQIGGKAVKFKSSAALPILYRQLTGGREFFRDAQAMGEENSRLVDMAWVMHRHACPDDTVEEVEWLERFEFMDINNILTDIGDMITAEQDTTSTAKKRPAR